MTRQELVGIYKKLDDNKFKLLDKGISFQFIIDDRGSYLNTGIGLGETMSMMNLYNIVSLYAYGSDKTVSIEEYAESVKQGIIDAYTKDVFHMQTNDSL